jgi:8-oxo-dGTP pyrophosphatase MutT (NUDIX family)
MQIIPPEDWLDHREHWLDGAEPKRRPRVRVSCGFIITCQNKWLIAHVTNGKTWDFPKGIGDDNEPELETALRETLEETGLDLRPYLGSLVDYGRHGYQPKKKDLHLYGIHVPELDLSKLVCESMVVRPNYSFPEVDAFMLIDPSKRDNFLAPRMLEWVNTHVISCTSSTSSSTHYSSPSSPTDSTPTETK